MRPWSLAIGRWPLAKQRHAPHTSNLRKKPPKSVEASPQTLWPSANDQGPTTNDSSFPFSHLSGISAKKRRAQALLFVPDWSIKVTAKDTQGLSRSVKQEIMLDRCAAITYAVCPKHQRNRSSLTFWLCSRIAATMSSASARALRPSSNETSGLERVRTASRKALSSARKGSSATMAGLAT